MRLFGRSELGASRTFDSLELADELESRRRKRRYAYPAWLCLGSHYLYLGRPLVQALFWLTGGGLLLWWLADLFRIPALVERQNRRSIEAVLRNWRREIEQRQPAPVVRAIWNPPERPREAEANVLEEDGADRGDLRPATTVSAPARFRFRPRSGAAAILIAIPFLVATVHVLAPRPVYPRSVTEPSFRTAREVNVRAGPSTSSAVVARLPANLLIRGSIESVTTEQPADWLRITRGPHKDRYVAALNLDRR